MISGTTVEVLRPGLGTVDRFNDIVPGEPASESVDGVLVADPTTEDLEAARQFGASISFVIHIPKAYTADLEGCTVNLPEPWANDGGYRVVGAPFPYMDANTPTPWNRAAMLEAVHG